jgi:hypothetical protein
VLTLRDSKADTNKGKIAHPLKTGMAAPRAGAVLRMKLRNSNPAAKVTGLDELAGKSNYFIGSDPAKWRTNVPTYAKVKYEGIYSGIDLVYYGNQRQLEYDFIVAPGADPHRIAFDIRGTKGIRQDVHGDLVLTMGEDEIRWRRPVVYQEKDGARQEVAACYAITGTNRVGFELAKYDASRPLYIDPMIYSTYLGGYPTGIAVDGAGSAYVIGNVTGGWGPVFVDKINPTGSALVYSAYPGASVGSGIAVDSAGNAYVTGWTGAGLPTTPGAFQTTYGGGTFDAFVTKLNPSGSALVYSTYLGGPNEDLGFGIAVDGAGNAYITGAAEAGFPLMNPLQPYDRGSSYTAFVTKVNPTGSALVYSTFFGGSVYDFGYGIAADSAGNTYVTGIAYSSDFPVTPGAFQTTFGGYYDAFVAKFNPAGSALVYSSYLGGSDSDIGYGIAADSAGDAYVIGGTSSANFPTTPGAFQTTYGGNGDAFVTEFNPTGSALVYSTYLGGSSGDGGSGIAVDSAGNAYVTGGTSSTDFPTMNPLQPTLAGSGDAFVSEFNSTGSALVYSTYLGGSGGSSGSGIAVDSSSSAYVTGSAGTAFPVTPGAFQTSGGYGFVAKIGNSNTTTSLVSSLNPSVFAQAVTFTAAVSAASGTPTGAVIFYDGSTVLGSATLASGSASISLSSLAAGSHSIIAAYQGSGAFDSGRSSPLNQVVNPETTTSSLASSLNPALVNESVTYIATVASQYGGVVTGSVVFQDGGSNVATVTMVGNRAAYTTKYKVAGLRVITATYSGDTNNAGSVSATLVEQINKGFPSKTVVTTSGSPSFAGQPVTYTATVTSTHGAVPDGELVTFYDNTTAIGTSAIASGVATFATSSLAAKTHTIKAAYGGDAEFEPSFGSVKQVVDKYTTTTALSSSLNPSQLHQTVTFTATVTWAGPTPTGEVRFRDGTKTLRTVALSGGVATLASKLAAGTHPITAEYLGDADNALSTSPVLDQVVQ